MPRVCLFSQRDIIQHFRDVVNLGELLWEDINKERFDFRKKLMDIGWAEEEIAEMEERAYRYTRFESELPHIQPDRGSWFEYIQKRGRTK